MGFEVLDRAIARHGYGVYIDGQQAGVVTSGTQTPFVKKNIGMAYLPADKTAPGTEFEIDVRGRRVKAQVVRDALLQTAEVGSASHVSTSHVAQHVALRTYPHIARST